MSFGSCGAFPMPRRCDPRRNGAGGPRRMPRPGGAEGFGPQRGPSGRRYRGVGARREAWHIGTRAERTGGVGGGEGVGEGKRGKTGDRDGTAQGERPERRTAGRGRGEEGGDGGRWAGTERSKGEGWGGRGERNERGTRWEGAVTRREGARAPGSAARSRPVSHHGGLFAVTRPRPLPCRALPLAFAKRTLSIA